MLNGTVVLLASPAVQTLPLDHLVPEFGWSLATAANLDQLRDLTIARNVVAILFEPNGLGLSPEHALRSVRDVSAHAFLIPCHRFSDVVNWPELADAGAFHALALPFDQGEVRQSLGFVWAARLRRAANVLSIRPGDRPELGESAKSRKLAAESVA
jgi:hypothetical protein